MAGNMPMAMMAQQAKTEKAAKGGNPNAMSNKKPLTNPGDRFAKKEAGMLTKNKFVKGKFPPKKK